uniref:DNA2/NAM7 helicase-like C-terminal domain-containing protein n=1 Tax=Meloidogyne enterolobii TaxID=390850 RepID=A0A6V7XHW7_MELEN|nr:unnamed protein product [Meloidogyne enterolobii]
MEKQQQILDLNNFVDFPPLSSTKKAPTPPKSSKSTGEKAPLPANKSAAASSSTVNSPPNCPPPSSSKNVDELTESTSNMSISSGSPHKRIINEMEIDGQVVYENVLRQEKGSEKKDEEKQVVGYLVCQVEENSVVGVRLRPQAHKKWPHFVTLKNDFVEKCDGFVNKVQLGDSVWVTDVEWKEDYRDLSRSEGDKSRKCWYVGKINTNAVVTGARLVVYAERSVHPGIVIKFKEKRGIRNCCMIISPGLQIASRCYRRQLVDLNLDEIEVGQLVNVSVASLSEDCIVDESYVLPAQTEYKFGYEEFIVQGKGVLGSVESHRPWPYIRNNQNVFYPLLPEMSNDEIRLSESLMGAAIGYSFEDEKKKMIENRFEGVPIFIDNRFQLWFKEIDNIRVRHLKDTWNESDQVVLKSAMHLPHFAIGVVKKINLSQVPSFGNKKFDLWISVKVINVQERKNRDVEQELEDAKDGGFLVCHPLIFKGLESRRECFEQNLPSMLSAQSTNQGKLLRALMAREFETDFEEESNASAVLSVHPLMNMLNEKQQKTAKILLEDGCKFVFQQAPPGVGKTHVASVVIALMLSILNNVKVAVVTAANLPLAKLAKELEEVLGRPAMEDSNAIAFFSGYAKEKYFGMIDELKQHMLVTKLKTDQVLDHVTKDDLREINDYCTNYELRPRLTKERRMGSLISEVSDLRIVFGTSRMAEDMVATSLTDATVLIFDEATQGSFTELAHLICRLPNLEKVLVTGDRHQLGVHLQSLPKCLQSGFGLESMVEQLVLSNLVRHTRLSVCYRMHPLIVEAVSFASYERHGESLEPGRGAEERSLLTTSKFPLPMQNCPIVLLNVIGTCRQDNTSHSLCNDEHSASAIKLISALFDKISTEISLVVICLYTFQKESLQKEFENLNWNVLVVTVDGYQAQEADLVILVTTRSSSRADGLGDFSEFLKDDNRATVALSRAKHGLFVIADFETLRCGIVWNRFICRATEFTQIVGPEYLQVLQSGSCMRDRFGQLLSSSGRMVADFVDEQYPQQQQQQPSTSSHGFGRTYGSTNVWSRNDRNSRDNEWFENLNFNKK